MNLSLQYCDNAWLLIITVAALGIACFFLGIEVEKIYGDDNEAELGLCQRGYKDHCQNEKLQHDLEGSLMIWNNANCSVRDICTPQTCFATKELAEPFMKAFGNESGDIHVPCPKVNVTASNNDLEGK